MRLFSFGKASEAGYGVSDGLVEWMSVVLRFAIKHDFPLYRLSLETVFFSRLKDKVVERTA